ncbi:MAG: hypothetical protein J6T60_10450 [Bacteroidales bacterium]|nr:hypothetical protein [Bacteroidales bacterium]
MSAVNKYIKDLVDLALQDRVMTYTERLIIVNAAAKRNIKADQVNKYIDKAVAKRMKDSLTKEEMQHCPSCGAQVPLIANDCLFCGRSLVGPERKVIKVDGEAAKRIQAENQKTFEVVSDNRRSIKQCPDCGAPFPLISHICTHCGHILHELQGSDLNANFLVDSIEKQRTKLEKIQVPTILNLLVDWIEVACFLLGCLLIWIGEHCDNSKVCWGFGIVFLIWGIVGGHDLYGGGTVNKADDAFYDAINNYKMYMRQISTLYGDNPEAMEALGLYSEEIEDFKKKRNHNRRWLFVIGFALFLCGAIPLGSELVDFYQWSRKPIVIDSNDNQGGGVDSSSAIELPQYP